MVAGASRGKGLRSGAIVAFLVMLVVAFIAMMPNRDVARAREESVRTLAAADSAAAMEEAVDDLGIVFHFADGSWIAVRYVDRHHGGFWSSAVALDSEARWYASEVHFCGQFRIYRGQWERTLELLQNPRATMAEKRPWLEDNPLQPASLRELEQSADLMTAREKLLGLGFRALRRPEVPKMSGPWPDKVRT